MFNSLVWDLCSALWRGSPLASDLSQKNDTVANSISILFSSFPEEILAKLQDQPNRSKIRCPLSITHGAVFTHFVSEFLQNVHLGAREIRYRDCGDSIDFLKDKAKRQYLYFLKRECGMGGIQAFLTTFIGSLAQREKRRKKSRIVVDAVLLE